ncbi:hypothetical protein EG68_12046 [Paragonimus skrjabini miyazakii]|uniref:Stress-associated endoplasmic reticulum protein n=1 Tax=Paragonimus skrjabini miyazakii TaxID=59628 RepID=A0A8S9YGR8_9TREM|nr:hypothetical protein EG68_12046 [Paragonimus skrjabini miyazakii]
MCFQLRKNPMKLVDWKSESALVSKYLTLRVMSANQRMKVQNERAHGNVKNRGNVPKSLSHDSQSNINAWIFGLIIFVVCGSAIFEIIQHVRMAL